MKVKLFTIAMTTLAMSCNQQTNDKTVSLTNQVDSTSFAIGVNVAENLGKNISQQFEDVNLDLLKAGLNAGIDTNNKSEISGAVAEQIIEEFFRSKQEKTAKKAIGEGAAFLAENAKREGVISLESGLQYEILNEGKGQIPTIDDKITAHYHGTLIDGTVEEVGLRSTRLRTLEGRIVTIPNSRFTDNSVTNVTSQPTLKVKLNLGLTYDTDEVQMQKAIDILEDIVKDQEAITDDYAAGFNGFGDFSLNILFIYYVKPDSHWLDTQTLVNKEILRRFNKEGLEFAFPTQTILKKDI